jgi:hypothetical protein
MSCRTLAKALERLTAELPREQRRLSRELRARRRLVLALAEMVVALGAARALRAKQQRATVRAALRTFRTAARRVDVRRRRGRPSAAVVDMDLWHAVHAGFTAARPGLVRAARRGDFGAWRTTARALDEAAATFRGETERRLHDEAPELVDPARADEWLSKHLAAIEHLGPGLRAYLTLTIPVQVLGGAPPNFARAVHGLRARARVHSGCAAAADLLTADWFRVSAGLVRGLRTDQASLVSRTRAFLRRRRRRPKTR